MTFTPHITALVNDLKKDYINTKMSEAKELFGKTTATEYAILSSAADKIFDKTNMIHSLIAEES